MSSGPPRKRSCPITVDEESSISLPFLLQLHEDEVWALAKSDLRRYFLSLQEHTRSFNAVELGQAGPNVERLPLKVSLSLWCLMGIL